MVKVCVAGLGDAGLAAARSALELGAAVTVLERSPGPPVSRWLWPWVIDDPSRLGSEACRPGIPSGIEVVYGEGVRGVARGHATTEKGARVPFDSLVVATGTRPLSSDFPGASREGVIVLGTASAYADFGLALRASASTFVAGEGLRALKVAEHASRFSDVSLVAGDLRRGLGVQPSTASAIVEAAARQGVSCIRGQLQRGAGSGRLEAVMCGGRVYSSDLLAVVPSECPCPPAIDAPLSKEGAVLVDWKMSSGSSKTYAAGGSAALTGGGPCGYRSLQREPSPSGLVAGANAAGGSVAYPYTESYAADLFGLRLVTAGVRALDPRVVAGEAATFTATFNEGLVCTVYFGRRSGRVLGIEAIGAPSQVSSESAGLAVALSVSLGALSQSVLRSSTDISALAETARQALRKWREY